MSSITVRDATKYFDHKLVLSDANITLSNDQKVVLVGENGAGKTTLLKLMSGELLPDSGEIFTDLWVDRILVQQEFHDYESAITVRQYLGSLWQKVIRLMAPLNFSQSVFDQDISSLSGGQKRLIELAKAFATSNAFLLLDEPENHLDFIARQWLIDQINVSRGGVVLVSHDQYVIDQVANTIIEIEDGETMVFTGSYQGYLENRERLLKGELRQWKQREDEIAHFKRVVSDLKQWAKRNSDFAKTYQSKVKKLAKLRDEQTDKPQLERRSIKARLNPVERKGGKKILSFHNYGLTIGGRELVREFTQDLWFGEKICLFGLNGCGKTSIFRTIRGDFTPTTGSVRVGPSIRVGFFSQDHAEEIDGKLTPYEEIQRIFGGNEGKIRPLLSRFLFDQISMHQKIETLSGGQKTRLRFAKLFNGDPELLLLDEPTNHLDRMTWDVLCESIKNFNGTVLLVSHDRAFVDQTVSKLWTFEEGLIKEYFGNMSEYIEDKINE